ncbi:Hsp20/alpha crystallin family protein [Ktedonobacter racemifer]|uniref:Heat shock protein Hsp20 n=1 Tax=Ktedonobacter racemifer DSM 44963 TaxID=485913 RepID=D6TPH3_KTERA|nr:Hsp20/alpha crystallin family protein [Ktedonobacter racemifer]EFH85587.1 heat shock protein Hsp20 [Ktedonobacter racemifer DSM 44963]
MANITRYKPFNEFVSLREAMDRLFEDSVITPRATTSFNRVQPVNLYETAEDFTLQVPMPGANPENVEINVQQDVVSLKWQTEVEIPENATVRYHGIQKRAYQQSFTVPSPINSERAEATYKDGILTLRLPKAEHARARTIKVNAANS